MYTHLCKLIKILNCENTYVFGNICAQGNRDLRPPGLRMLFFDAFYFI